MALQTRAQLVTLLNSKVLSIGNRTTAQNIRDFENAIIESLINHLDDVNQNGGYLGIDNSGLVNISFIKAATPTGKFLRDDGTWQIGGSGIPIARYVYLVQDAGDATIMGGSSNNVYTTFQAAYNAANTLQASLGGSNVVCLQVLNTTAATVGDLTLSATFNRLIIINGINPFVSNLGNIIANGIQIGTSLAPVRFSNVRIGNITTSNSLSTGNGGQIGLSIINSVLGNFDTSLTNAANTGAAGLVNTVNTNPNPTLGSSIIGNITTSAANTIATAGNVVISSVRTGTITTANNNLGGLITLTGQRSFILGISVLSLSNASVTITDCSLQTISFSSTNGNFTLTNSTCNALSVTTTGKSIITNSDTAAFTSTLSSICEIRNSNLNSITNLGTNSIVAQSVIGSINTILPTAVAIDQVGTGVKIYDSVVIGTTAIQNSSSVYVLSRGSVFDGIVSSNISLSTILNVFNNSVAPQGPGFNTDTYIIGSNIAIPNFRLKIGTIYKCTIKASKTAAGIATPIFNIRFGTNGTTSDASLGSFTFPLQTATIDNGLFQIYATFDSVGGGTSASLRCTVQLFHDNVATGFSTSVSPTLFTASSGFNSTVLNSIIGVSVNGGASASWTIEHVMASIDNLN